MEKIFRKASEDEEAFNSLNPVEQDMIRGIVDLSDTTVKEVMVPRIDVVFIENDTPEKELLETLIECGHSRVPVYDETIDNVVGILYVKDLLNNMLKNSSIDIAEVIRKPYFVPESKRLDSLLYEFKRRRVHIAVAVDEYGGVSGIVCMEDIIEEIVGDIQDEFDNEVEDIMEIGENTYLCDARIDIEDLNEITNLNLSDKDYDTLGGFVFELFGKIPVRYEKAETPEAEFIIHDMEGHKIKTIKLVKKVSIDGSDS
ncbi:MAG: HlyC/CorC family transporter [Spirochaetales bacterium]|nr:HlyC/CorC family transporter [Spirochaetales bacterium]